MTTQTKTLPLSFATLVLSGVFVTSSCATRVADVPLLDRRTPALGPDLETHAVLLSRHVCDNYMSVNIWYEAGGSGRVWMSIFDPYQCREIEGVFASSNLFHQGERATMRSAATEAPVEVLFGQTACGLSLPIVTTGDLHVVIEVDAHFGVSGYDTFTPAQDRRLERRMRKRERPANACHKHNSRRPHDPTRGWPDLDELAEQPLQ